MCISRKILIVLLLMHGKTCFAQTIAFDSSVEQVFNNLKKTRTTNIVDAVLLLNKQFFKRENYVLIFDSQSPQTSSPEAPRVLLFGKDKQLRIGFNHNRKDGQDLEIIQWRDLTRTWEFREIKFTPQGPILSKADPIMCLQCHRDHKPKIVAQEFMVLLSDLKPKINKEKFLRKVQSDPIYKKLERPLN